MLSGIGGLFYQIKKVADYWILHDIKEKKKKSMKKVLNKFTGKEDYFLTWREAAEHIGMSEGVLKYRHTEECALMKILNLNYLFIIISLVFG